MNQSERGITSALLMCALMACGADAFAQVGGYGRLSGRISDAQKASVGDAKLELVNKGTSAKLEGIAQKDGNYAFARVAPGEYTLSVEKQGFRRTSLEVVVAIDSSVRADVELQLGRVEESIVVLGQATLIQSQSSESSTLLPGRMISGLAPNFETSG